jgi:plastocyanin domain-containing protein
VPGLYAYDLNRLANSQVLTTYKLKDAIVGVNKHIDFCHNSYRISFLKNFDNIEMVPVPHRNTINFLGMQPK